MKENICGKYKHFKGGVYVVFGIDLHSETLEEMVVYRHEGEEGMWVRPKEMFFGEKEVDGVLVPRFVKIEE